MPLLNKQRVPLSTAIPFETSANQEEAWYIQMTNEVFTNYELYLEKLQLYQQPIWECESSGKTNLTYEEALDSEKNEYFKVAYKICSATRKVILNRVQFQTLSIDDLVEDVYMYLSNNYSIDEIIQCKLNNYEYFGRIVDIIQPSMTNIPPRQSNGRLLFPDAFLVSEQNMNTKIRIQLIDTRGRPIEEYIREVGKNEVYRERSVLNRRNLKIFIQESCSKSPSLNSQWLLKKPMSHKRRLNTIDTRETDKRVKFKEEKRKNTIKYPLEDLDLPIYRQDPLSDWNIIDMSQLKDNTMTIPYPKAGKSERPTPYQETSIPTELYSSFLSIWAFMTIFAEPLKIAAYTLDEFEKALLHKTHQPKATVLVEYNASLLNVIIQERDDDTPNELLNGDLMDIYVEDLEDEHSLPRVERGWRDSEGLKLCQKWDHKELRANYHRRGWETSLIGCLNDVATPDLLPDVDELLQHLIPKLNSSAADREKQYPTLSIKQKLDILNFLMNAVNESSIIKNYIDHCQEQLSEFRKQKIELNKNAKALSNKRTQLDKQVRLEKPNENSSEESDNNNSDFISNQKKAKNSEQRIRAKERKLLEESEKDIKKQEDHLERSIRRYNTLRIRPLGKDRFYNRYFYFDNIGETDHCGSGRLFIHAPSNEDIRLMMERDHTTDLPKVPWGYGGGTLFIQKLMQDQGLVEESNWLKTRMNERDSNNHGWWKYYSKPEEISQLIDWLNPKGIRESTLKNELTRLQPYIEESMLKRANTLLTKTEPPDTIRTRSKK